MENQIVKVGVYTSGSSVRIIGEHDLTEQKFSHRDEAIYLVEVAIMRDPSTHISDNEITQYIKSMKKNFVSNNFQFKAKNRKDADLFIKSKIEKWDTVRELSPA